MSPSEMDLRAALQHGGGDGLNVNADAIIREGQAIRARRVRILSGAAVAVLVAGGAVGLAALRGSGGGAGTHAALDRLAPQGSAQSGRGGGIENSVPKVPAPAPIPSDAVAGGADLAAGAECPDTAPHLLLPGGGSPGQFGSDGPLFAKPVDVLVVCSYATADPAGSAPGRLSYNGPQADQIVAGMENSHRQASDIPCDPGATSTARLLVFIGVTPDGKAQPAVTATVTDPACNVQLTNGTAVRDGWTPPALLTGELRGLTPPKVPPRKIVDEPTGTLNGSPLHS